MTSATTGELGELTGDYVLDTARTRIGFVARMLLVVGVRGRFGEFEGSGHVDGDDPSRSTARLTIQASSIRTGNRRRDAHLRRDFLRVDRHPAITFASTKVEQAGATSYRLTGDLTIRGVTRSVTVGLELVAGDDRRVGFRGEATIDRRDWGVCWNTVLEGGGLGVSNEVTLEFEVVAERRTAPLVVEAGGPDLVPVSRPFARIGCWPQPAS